MDNEARILLDDTIEFCRRDGLEARLIKMLEQCNALSLEDDALTIQVPSRFAYTYLVKQRDVIERYLEEITFGPVALEVVTDSVVAGATTAGATARATAHSTSTQESGIPSRSTGSGAGFAPALEAQFDPMGLMTPVATPTPAPEPGQSPAMFPGSRDAVPIHAQSHVATPATTAPSIEEVFAAPQRRGFPASTNDEDAKPINVRNTIGAEELLEIQRRMEGGEAKRPRAASPNQQEIQKKPEQIDGPAVDINSKFTFENFVSGDENKHAYNSAMRFAAYADVPGQAPSLFIYGNSGLGKTHLLFAIKNYLAEEMPNLRVKYANSQAYFEDYLHELSTQKGAGGMIMREYRDADILIIDDIQNIVNKQATIEFFFQLVDGFIRSGKKIVIASDRAPKKLGLDERLTSRFNAGMLCLVSEPGFEMKYLILKRYYENVIVGSSDVATINAGTSLLSALQVREGHLTDEQLRHMAEISGNNIRSLESFCERCAGMSSEREAEGGELTAEDIDRVANQYFDTARKVIHIDTVQEVVEEYYHVSHEDLIGPRRTANIVFARHVAVYLANNLCEMTTPAIGSEFGGRDHSTVLNSIKVVESKMKDDRRICDDLQQLKNKIILKS